MLINFFISNLSLGGENKKGTSIGDTEPALSRHYYIAIKHKEFVFHFFSFFF